MQRGKERAGERESGRRGNFIYGSNQFKTAKRYDKLPPLHHLFNQPSKGIGFQVSVGVPAEN
jgi:hypothetical protein